ncbi:MAG: cyanophycin synthetase, partial [Chloroflexota bacterium]|nr:cyanophycin synthetase [Chloroflexota bacterium]
VPRSGTAVLNADDPHVARMGRHCAGRVVYFSMQTAKGEDGFDRVDGHAGRGGAAFILQDTDEGELVVLRLGSRTMPVLYTHLIPATFGGRARMNVANALAAAAAAWASGAHLHDIRQGLRTFSTSFFQAPGRLNMLELGGGVRAVIDYCHNVDGMRHLADFVNRMMIDSAAADVRPERRRSKGTAPGLERRERTGRAIGVLGIPGDRRDDDQKMYGTLAAGAFDEIIVREDRNLRGRETGVSAGNVLAGVAAAKAGGGARTGHSEAILDEMAAVRAGLARAKAGDLVVMCVDDAVSVYREAMAASGTSARGGSAFADPGELEAPDG